MSKVDWSVCPEGAQFYSYGNFRKHTSNDCEYYWSNGFSSWKETRFDTLGCHKKSPDFAMRPVSDHIAELAAKTLKECVEQKKVSGETQWTSAHYDNYYQLTEADIKEGKIKVDAYFVCRMWKLNAKDDTGALFHSLKAIARFGDKNPIERELKALYAQTKRMAELYGVDLEC